MILVAYASKHGATREIADRIARRLRASGHDADARPVTAAADLAACEAFVIGSAVYYGSWLKEATEFVRGNRAVLESRPVWLFSSGPLGTEPTDAKGRDLREASAPKQIGELTAAIRPREHRVFFGAMDYARLGLTERVLTVLPAGRELLPQGDFRSWEEVDAWATGIANALAHETAAP